MEPDFAQLYAQLDLRPDCTLDEFKRAYRRRVAELHPDRMPVPTGTRDAGISLSELTSLYTTATRFHRHHGRLPGAPATFRTDRADAPAGLPVAVPRAVQPPSAPSGPEPGPGRIGTRFAVLAVLVVIALIVILEATSPPATVTEPDEEASRLPASGAGAGR